MMTDEKNSDGEMNAAIVAKCVEDMLLCLHDEGGIPTAEVLAAAHGQIIVMLACFIGGETAAERCLAAAQKVRPIPSLQDVRLATTEPKGRA